MGRAAKVQSFFESAMTDFTEQLRRDYMTHDVRLFVRRGRGCAKGRLLVTDEKNGEKFGGVGNND